MKSLKTHINATLFQTTTTIIKQQHQQQQHFIEEGRLLSAHLPLQVQFIVFRPQTSKDKTVKTIETIVKAIDRFLDRSILKKSIAALF